MKVNRLAKKIARARAVRGKKVGRAAVIAYVSPDSVRSENFWDAVADVNSPVESLRLRGPMHGSYALKLDGARIGAYIRHGMSRLDGEKSQNAESEETAESA